MRLKALPAAFLLTGLNGHRNGLFFQPAWSGGQDELR